MVYRPSIDERLCFVLMPFGDPFDSYYERIIIPAVEDAHLEALRADGIYGTGSIIRDVWRQIWLARVVIADVTGKNANVNYELGLCHALGVPTILITKQIEDVPFDYRHRRCITYDTEDLDWIQKLREALRRTIEAVVAGKELEEDLLWPYDTSKAVSSPGVSLLTSENPRDLVAQGAKIVAKRIAKAIGPAGRRFSVSIGNREPMPHKRGYNIAQGVRAVNPLEGRGIRQMQRVAEEINNIVGDGTKFGILVAQSLIEQGNDAFKRGFLPREVLAGMKRGIDHATVQLKRLSKVVIGDRLLQIATTAAMDSETGHIIAAAIDRVGKDGVITIEESASRETTIEVVEGMELDRGFLSEHFVTDPDHLEVVLDNPYILIHDRKISSMKDLLPLLEQIAESNEPLLIIAEDVEGEALATLVINKMRGTLKIAAIKAPGFADRRKATLDDIATVTGAKVVSADLGIMLASVTLEDLGRAKSVTINKEITTIVEGAGSQKEIEARVRTLRKQIEEVASPYDREKLQERLARLVGGVAVIRIGGVSQVEILDKKYQTVSAMHAARSAIESGWVTGGGIALYNAAQSVRKISCSDGAQVTGLLCVANALENPIRHLIENAQASPTQALHEISQTEKLTMGFNVDAKRVEDLEDAGIIDSTEMLCVSLKVAYAHSKSVLETEDWDLESPQSPETSSI